jgi:hypothetical protein
MTSLVSWWIAISVTRCKSGHYFFHDKNAIKEGLSQTDKGVGLRAERS